MPQAQSSLQQLKAKVGDLAEDLDALEALFGVDVPSSLNKIRFITEKVLQRLCKKANVSWGQAEPTLERMIGPLVAGEHIPKNIAVHVRTIQMNTSPGSHYQESAMSDAHVRIAQNALIEFLEWYCRQVIGTNDAPNAEQPAVRSRSVRPRAFVAAVVVVGVLGLVGGGLIAQHRNQADENQRAELPAPNPSPGTEQPVPKQEPSPPKEPEVIPKKVNPVIEKKDPPAPIRLTRAEADEIEIRIQKSADAMGNVAVRTLVPQAQPGTTVVQSTKLSADGKFVEVVIRVQYESVAGKQSAPLKFVVDKGGPRNLALVDRGSLPGATDERLKAVEERWRWR